MLSIGARLCRPGRDGTGVAWLADRRVIFVGRTILILGFLLAWEFLSRAERIDPFLFSRPTLIWDSLVALVRSDDFPKHVRTTISEALGGLVIGSVAGIVTGFVFAKSPTTYRLFSPIVTALNAVPRIALVSLFILWFGFGTESKTALVVSLVYFIMLLNTYAAVMSVDPDLVNTVRLLRAGRFLSMRRLYLPYSAPFLAAGLRISLAFAISAAVVGEMLVSQYGLGHVLRQRQDFLDTAGVFAVLTVISTIALGLTGIVRAIELRLTRWRPNVADAGNITM